MAPITRSKGATPKRRSVSVVAVRKSLGKGKKAKVGKKKTDAPPPSAPPPRSIIKKPEGRKKGEGKKVMFSSPLATSTPKASLNVCNEAEASSSNAGNHLEQGANNNLFNIVCSVVEQTLNNREKPREERLGFLKSMMQHRPEEFCRGYGDEVLGLLLDSRDGLSLKQ